MPAPRRSAPVPLAAPGRPVDWLFAFKFNAQFALDHPDPTRLPKKGIFGGTLQAYPGGHCQQYVYATSEAPRLVKGTGALGATRRDPLGATFGQIYLRPRWSYVLWNDQFYGSPLPTRDVPWGHSKGLVAWNDRGEGMVLQTSTPCWPGSGSVAHPRRRVTSRDMFGKTRTVAGNTLGYIAGDDDIEVSQHVFALRLAPDDLRAVLRALAHASVVTDTTGKHPSIARISGPADVQELARALGKVRRRGDATPSCETLSSGVLLVTKPSSLHVPPWQMVSAVLGGLPLRVASWWAAPAIPSTTSRTKIGCWPATLRRPGPVQIATTGHWRRTELGLEGAPGKNYNHAKVAVSLDRARPLSLFGDMNQMGAMNPSDGGGDRCAAHQNGRGGLFYAVEDRDLWQSVSALLRGASAPIAKAPKRSRAGGSPAAEPAAAHSRTARPSRGRGQRR